MNGSVARRRLAAPRPVGGGGRALIISGGTVGQDSLITGVTGQDGSYLAEFLLAKGYDVHGIKRRASLFNTERVDHIYQDPHAPDGHFTLHYGDLTDGSNLTGIINRFNLTRSTILALNRMSPSVSKHRNTRPMSMGSGPFAFWRRSGCLA